MAFGWYVGDFVWPSVQPV